MKKNLKPKLSELIAGFVASDNQEVADAAELARINLDRWSVENACFRCKNSIFTVVTCPPRAAHHDQKSRPLELKITQVVCRSGVPPDSWVDVDIDPKSGGPHHFDCDAEEIESMTSTSPGAPHQARPAAAGKSMDWMNSSPARPRSPRSGE